MNEFTLKLQKAKDSLHTQQKFEKNFYIEHENVKKRSQQEVVAFLASHDVEVTPTEDFKPVLTIVESSFPEYITQQFKRAGFTKPTPIQSIGWPIILSGRDVVALAETGSGKTLVFILPALVHINAQPILQNGDGPIALVIVPTRELAIQIQEQATKFGRTSRIGTTCVYGGVPKGPQQAALSKGVETVIATPGRLLDHIDVGSTNLRKVTFLVLDEADRMLDMGFEPYIRKLLGMTRKDRQTLMFSATWPKVVRTLAAEFLQPDVVHIKVGASELQANSNVEQEIQLVEEDQKEAAILKLLDNLSSSCPRILVFVETKRKCDALTQTLRENGIVALGLHGDKKQEEREWVLNEFRAGAANVLVATGLAARGLDIKDVSLVVNFDFPAAIEDYIHRIGRTGRAGASGRAISYFSSQNYRLVKELVKVLEEVEQTITPELWAIAYPDQPMPSPGQHDAPGPDRHVAPRQRAAPYPTTSSSSSSPAPGSPQGTSDGRWSSMQKDCLPSIVSADTDYETVLLLRNMVGPGEVDDELQDEIMEECTKFGPVKETHIFERTDAGCPAEEAVRIFIKFLQREVLYKALVALHGRAFGGRAVCASIYDHERYAKLDLGPSEADPPMPRVILLRNMVAPGEVDDELELEVKDECQKYGEVEEVKVREVADRSVPPEEAVRIFVLFRDFQSTLEACRDLNGRLFGGHLIHCCLYDNNRYFARMLDANKLLDPVLPQKCFLPLTTSMD
eukprot:GGOE01022445.1.p1 GENE.GGOE01022445.1~~GGOE01022445.1.p1  ORF type:complete len:738 (+),score=202.76 GGOE01022445.1:67-2280(+)